MHPFSADTAAAAATNSTAAPSSSSLRRAPTQEEDGVAVSSSSSTPLVAATRPAAPPLQRRGGRGLRLRGRARCGILGVLALALLGATVLQYMYMYRAATSNGSTVPAVKRGKGGSGGVDNSALPLSDFLIPNKILINRTTTSSSSSSLTADNRRSSPTTRTRTSTSTSSSLPPEPNYHVIFSTSCVPLQHWQSYLFFYSALKVKQPGNVTRIVSGCTPQQTKQLREFHSKVVSQMSDRFHIHFTPDYSTVRLEKGVNPFKFGVLHWMEHALKITPKTSTDPAQIPAQYRDDIVMLLDPDMVLLRPLRHDFTNEQVLWVTHPPATTVVRHGYPISQQDGYLGLDWMGLDWSYITNQTNGQFQKPPPVKEGDKHWIAGPPYKATVQDMYKIAVLWAEYSPRVLDLYPDIFAEMFGYIIASCQLQLPHTFIKSIVVSVTDSDRREGWKYIDELPDDQVCHDVSDVPMPPSARMPIGLHYCQRYFLGEYFFVKYRVKKNILDCDQALYVVPPKDLMHRYNYSVVPKRADGSDQSTWIETRTYVRPHLAKREAFMLCRMIHYLNEALRFLKDRTCDGHGNLNETISVYLDPTD